jgi:hypothetical protein
MKPQEEEKERKQITIRSSGNEARDRIIRNFPAGATSIRSCSFVFHLASHHGCKGPYCFVLFRAFVGLPPRPAPRPLALPPPAFPTPAHPPSNLISTLSPNATLPPRPIPLPPLPCCEDVVPSATVQDAVL